jgi:hypothetical protein
MVLYGVRRRLPPWTKGATDIVIAGVDHAGGFCNNTMEQLTQRRTDVSLLLDVYQVCATGIHYSVYLNHVIQGQDMDQASRKLSSALIHATVDNMSGTLLIHPGISEHWLRYVYYIPTAHREIRFVQFRMYLILAHPTIGLPEATKYFPTRKSPFAELLLSILIDQQCLPLVTSPSRNNETKLTCSLDLEPITIVSNGWSRQ